MIQLTRSRWSVLIVLVPVMVIDFEIVVVVYKQDINNSTKAELEGGKRWSNGGNLTSTEKACVG